MKTITREEFKKAVFDVLEEIADITEGKSDLTSGAVFQLVGLTIMTRVDKVLFGEED